MMTHEERREMRDTRPLVCGHSPSVHDEYTTGTAQTADGREICWECADRETRETMKTADRIVLYLDLSEGSGKVTSWSGGRLGTVTSHVTRRMRTPNSPFKHSRVFVRVTDLDDRVWVGSSPGSGMYVRLRATRAVPQRKRGKRV